MCCHQQVCAKHAQTLEAELRDSRKQLEDTQKILQDTQKALRNSRTALQDIQNQFQVSQVHFQDTREELQGTREELQGTREELHGTQEELEEKNERLEKYESDIEGLKLRLFHRYREAEKYTKLERYNEAKKIYEEILSNYKEAILPEAILEMRYSYAEQLREQGKFPEAKKIAEDVWERRKELDSLSKNPKMMSEESKKSHRQVCSIYNSLGEFDAAEKEQMSVYHGAPKDAWKLENGDALCITLMKHKRCEEAAQLQLRVWEERRQLEKPGRWEECTIRSALSRVDFLEIIVKNLSDTLQKNCREKEINEMLRHVWTMPKAPELRLQIQKVGHKLGTRLVAGGEYADAERVLKDVWEAGTALYPEAKLLTMSTGKELVDVLKLQESPQQYKRAARLYRSILDEAKHMFGEDDDWVISVGIALAETLFRDGQNAGPDGAEQIWRWVLDQKTKKLGQADPQVHDARYNLGKAVLAQGRERYPEHAQILQGVYDRWNKDSPKPSVTVECGRLLVKAYEDGGLATLEPVRALFNGRSEKDMVYLESGHLLGKLLLRKEDFEGARQLLESFERDQPEMCVERSPEGDQVAELLEQVAALLTQLPKKPLKKRPQRRVPNSFYNQPGPRRKAKGRNS